MTKLSGWSSELQSLQDETMHLLHVIRGNVGSRQPNGQASREGKTLGKKHGEREIAREGYSARIDARRSRRRRRRRRMRKATGNTADSSHEANGAEFGVRSSMVFPSNLDASGWVALNGDPTNRASNIEGVGKTTVEVLDKGDETPRSTQSSAPSVPEDKRLVDMKDFSGKTLSPVLQGNSKAPTVVAVPSDDEDERGYRSLNFKDEEGRVRAGLDTYVLGGSGLSDALRRLKDERDRLAKIAEAQRETFRGTKGREFLRLARRKWFASDRAALVVQRVFRGHLGRRRAKLAQEARRIAGAGNAEWIEVRDHEKGETWYFNPLTGKSQWDRPESLLGTITPSDKVRALPMMEQSSRSRHSPSPQGGRSQDCLHVVGGENDFPSQSIGVLGAQKCLSTNETPSKTGTREGGCVEIATTNSKLGDSGEICAPSGRNDRAHTAPSLPPLMRGSRHSILSAVEAVAAGRASTGGPALSSGLCGELPAWRDGTIPGKRQQCGDKQHAWVEDEFPFLRDENLLPDDRYEETGLGLAPRDPYFGRSDSSRDSDDSSTGAGGFFLADGTPNIRLRRTVAKALRVTKFDSVSTLLADYTGQNAASSSSTATSDTPLIGTRTGDPTAETSTDVKHRGIGGGALFASKKRGRNAISGNVFGNERGGKDHQFSKGKLEEDRESSPFASTVSNARRMVSVMTAGRTRRKIGDDAKGKGHLMGLRRAKTAEPRTGERAGSLKGLAIRDITPAGFSPLISLRSPESHGQKLGEGGRMSFDHDGEERAGESDGMEVLTGKGVQASPLGATDGISANKSSGTAVGVSGRQTENQAKEICFNCWSKGSGKMCTLHGRSENAIGDGKAGGVRPTESALMCKNWDVGVMRRRYRAEELQEIFAKEASSLLYDKARKKFVSVVEQRHPIYRLVTKILAGYNFTVRRREHQRNWLRALVEQLRMGKLGREGAGGRPGRTLRLRNTLRNTAQVRAFAVTARPAQPLPPITGTTLPERSGLVRVLLDRPSAVMGHVTRVVIDGPTPVPIELFEARMYELPLSKTMPMPEPKYVDANALDDESDSPPATTREWDGDEKRGVNHAAWFDLFCGTTAGDIIRSAKITVEVMSPVLGMDDSVHTKCPPALTIKFATFSRKPTPGMMAVGGLPAEMVLHMLVSTRMLPRYGNFTVMQKSSVAPAISIEESAHYDSLELLVENQAFLPRELQHPLNTRKAPTIIAKTFMKDPSERHYFGTNRPEQTGEEGSHGFRTSAHAEAARALPFLDPIAFTPSEEVVTPNLCSANRTMTTHADRSYPFCEPSNRSNTTLDFYHLLLTATCSPNKEQVFTNLGVQECGEFMRESDPLRPMGHCIGVVYRSWAFLQRQVMEEFQTDDGVPYWFNRITGETLWERPLCDEEKAPVKEGGTVLSGKGELPDSSIGGYEDMKPRYDQAQMRKLMMKTYEDTEALERRRKHVSTQVKWARESGVLPPPDPNEVEPSSPALQGNEDISSEGRSVSISINRETEDIISTGPSVATATLSTVSSSATLQERMSFTNESGKVSIDGSREGMGSERFARGRGTVAGGESRKPKYSEGSEFVPRADRLAASIAQALADTGIAKGRSMKPADMLRIGMGLGMTLGAKGLLEELGGGQGQAQDEREDLVRAKVADAKKDEVLRSGAGAANGLSMGGIAGDAVEASLAPPVVKITPNGHPIGHGHADPVPEHEESMTLNHESEAAHLASISKDDAELRTAEEFKGLLVVPSATPSPCPDEQYGVIDSQNIESDPRRKAESSVPIVAYPEMLWKRQYRGHGAAGEGMSWQPAEGDSTVNQRAKSSLGITMRRTNEPLPEGFLNAISHTHVGKQYCDYLPHVPNMPQARAVGRVRPRSAAEDWFAVGFDPWSAGREPLSVEFIPTLSIKQEDLGISEEGGGKSTIPQTGYLELRDSAGHAEMSMVTAEEAKTSADFEKIASWARHGRYSDIETAMNQADWMMPIDYQNEQGMTILHVAAQNGNKRIVKLCVRRGADINKRNNNGQTALHYAYSYGFESLGEYLISKGADDSITNADGLTCYEGLNQTSLQHL